MKKLIVLFCVLFMGLQMKAQLSCATFSPIQVGSNTYSFNLTSWPPGMLMSAQWNFGDGNSSTQFMPTHTYANSGYYNVCVLLQTMDSINMTVTTCQACDSVFVQAASGPCMAGMSYSQTSPNSFDFMGFGSGPGTITGYFWDFGDGTTSTFPSPPHTYSGTGGYQVCLTVNGVDSLNIPFSCTQCDSVYVMNWSTPCSADFMYNQISGSTFNFTDLSTGPGSITGYSWDFGDGFTSLTQNPSHTYTATGAYTVCLTINGYDSINSTFFSCTYCDSLFAQVGGGSTCLANFTYSASSGSTFHFTNTSVVQGTITNYMWSFGDGGTSTLPNPTHTYSATGNYTACLTIVVVYNGSTTTCTYCDSSIFAQVSSSSCFVNAAFSSSSNALNASFTNSTTCTSCSSMTYNWNFGDGGTSTAANPTHTYATGGTYNVCLIVTGVDSGSVCYDTICHSITVGLSAVGQLDNNQLTVYPNPTSSQFAVELPTADTYFVNLSDATGRIIRREYVQSSSKKIMMDISNLTGGVYRLTLSSGNKKYTAKILKQ